MDWPQTIRGYRSPELWNLPSIHILASSKQSKSSSFIDSRGGTLQLCAKKKKKSPNTFAIRRKDSLPLNTVSSLGVHPRLDRHPWIWPLNEPPGFCVNCPGEPRLCTYRKFDGDGIRCFRDLCGSTKIIRSHLNFVFFFFCKCIPMAPLKIYYYGICQPGL